LIAPGGGAVKRLIAGPGPEADPAWSPGGRKLAFAPFLGEVESRRQRISVVDLDTGAIAAVPGSDGLWSPRWSPDGARFAALDERFRLCLLRPQDGSKLHVADSAGFPQWSPDGASLYYLLGAQQMIVRSSVPGLRAAPIIALTDSMAGNIVASDASHNSWVGFDPDGAPMILRDSGSEEVYAIELSPK
jgi:Tol biopolymer transport system component